MQFTQSARLHLENDARHGGGNGELRTIHTPLNTTVECLVGLLGKKTVFVR